jgi:hypothetical protein
VLSVDPLLQLQSRVFSFYRLSDKSQTTATDYLTALEIGGNTSKLASVNVPTDNAYSPGGRVYFETTFNSSHPDYEDTISPVNFQSFLDINLNDQLPFKTPSSANLYPVNNSQGLGVGPIIAILASCLVVIGTALGLCLRRRKSKLKKQ